MAVVLFPRSTPPIDGTSASEFLTIGGVASGGTFRAMLDGEETTDIAWDADSAVLGASLQAALEALSHVGVGNVTVTPDSPDVGDWTIEWGGSLARRAVDLLTVSDNSLTGTAPTVAATRLVVGVAPDPLYPPNCALAIDGVAGAIYVNTGTQDEPAWVEP